MELAGERARMQSSEETLHQIVESRERGREMLQVLEEAPVQGFTASELAGRMKISPSNLSPLIRLFYVHGVIDRNKLGKNAFLQLTQEGRAVLNLYRSADAAKELLDQRGKKESIAEEKIFQKAISEVLRDILDTPFRSKRAILGAAKHGICRIEEQYRVSNPTAAELLHALGEEINHSMGIVSEAAREVINELRDTPDSSNQSPAEMIQTKLTEKEALHRDTAPLAALVFRIVSEGFKQLAV